MARHFPPIDAFDLESTDPLTYRELNTEGFQYRQRLRWCKGGNTHYGTLRQGLFEATREDPGDREARLMLADALQESYDAQDVDQGTFLREHSTLSSLAKSRAYDVAKLYGNKDLRHHTRVNAIQEVYDRYEGLFKNYKTNRAALVELVNQGDNATVWAADHVIEIDVQVQRTPRHGLVEGGWHDMFSRFAAYIRRKYPAYPDLGTRITWADQGRPSLSSWLALRYAFRCPDANYYNNERDGRGRPEPVAFLRKLSAFHHNLAGKLLAFRYRDPSLGSFTLLTHVLHASGKEVCRHNEREGCMEITPRFNLALNACEAIFEDGLVTPPRRITRMSPYIDAITVDPWLIAAKTPLGQRLLENSSAQSQ